MNNKYNIMNQMNEKPINYSILNVSISVKASAPQPENVKCTHNYLCNTFQI